MQLVPNQENTPAGASSPVVALVRHFARKVIKDAEILRLARNVAWSSFGVVLSQVITLVAYVALARYIGKERFGEFTIIQGTANTVSAFAGLGFGITATKYIAELRQREPAQAGSVMAMISLITLIWTALLTLVIWVAAPEIASEILKRPELASAVRIGAVLLFFTAIMNVQNGALAGFESFDAVAKTSMLRGFLILPFLLAGAAMGGVRGALVGFAAVGALICAVNYNLLRRRCNLYSIALTLRGGLARLRLLAAFSIPAFLANILPAPCLSLAQLLLVRQPGGYGDVAIFSAAFQIRTGIVLVPRFSRSPLCPCSPASMPATRPLATSSYVPPALQRSSYLSLSPPSSARFQSTSCSPTGTPSPSSLPSSFSWSSPRSSTQSRIHLCPPPSARARCGLSS